MQPTGPCVRGKWICCPLPTTPPSSGLCPEGGDTAWWGGNYALPRTLLCPRTPAALPGSPTWPHLGMAVFAGNPCLGTRRGLGRTLSGNLATWGLPVCGSWQPTAKAMQVLALDSAFQGMWGPSAPWQRRVSRRDTEHSVRSFSDTRAHAACG